MKAVLCIDVEPDERTPDPSTPADWFGAERLVEHPGRLRELLGGQAINWFFRFDHQVEVLHGAASWPADRFDAAIHRLIAAGDEIGAHPHNWRSDGSEWIADGTESWVVHNAARSIEVYSEVFGRGPASFRYGDRFVSDGVTQLLVDHPDVHVDLTPEPGTAACRGLVDTEQAIGVTRNVDVGLARRYRPDGAAVDIPSDTGGLTIVPLTVAAVPGTGNVETLALWLEPAQFDRMLRVRLLDRDLDHLAFAIRSDIALLPWAMERLEANLVSLSASVPALEWVRASSLALQPGERSDQGLGPIGSVVHEVDEIIRVVHPDPPVVVPPLAETVRTVIERGDESERRADALAGALAAAEQRLADECGRTSELELALATAQRRAESLSERIDAIEGTALWRLRTLALPILRPVASGRRRAIRRWESMRLRRRR